MFKRRDWLLTKGGQGNSDDDSSDSSSDESDLSSSLDSGLNEDQLRAQGLDSEDDEPDSQQEIKRLEELSESDFDDGGAMSDSDDVIDDENNPFLRRKLPKKVQLDVEKIEAEAEALKAAWKRGDTTTKGRPMGCRLCPKILLLNSASYHQHVTSNKHKKALTRAGLSEKDASQPITMADLVRQEEMDKAAALDAEAGETHTDRLERIRRALEAKEKKKPNQSKEGEEKDGEEDGGGKKKAKEKEKKKNRATRRAEMQQPQEDFASKKGEGKKKEEKKKKKEGKDGEKKKKKDDQKKKEVEGKGAKKIAPPHAKKQKV